MPARTRLPLAGMPPRPASIKVRALQWLAQREHSPRELRAKLLHLMSRQPAVPADQGDDAASFSHSPGQAVRSSPEAEVDALLQWLAARGYLSSERFVESRVHARQARFGNLRIRHELQQHGLRLDDGTRQALQASEELRAREVWQRKFGRPASDAPQRLQQLRFLVGRGFSMDVVHRVVLGAAREAGRRGAGGDEIDDMDGIDGLGGLGDSDT